MKRKDYEKPTTHVVNLKHQALLQTESVASVSGSATLGAGWTDSGGDAWNVSSGSSGGGGLLGGWTDSGDDAWE